MNGIPGSYHVNNHHISIQLTQRYLDSKIYAPINCSIPMNICHFCTGLGMTRVAYNRKQNMLLLVHSLPLLNTLYYQKSWILYMKFLKLCILKMYIRLLSYVLCRQSRALLVKDYVIGARHSQSSLVLAKKGNSDTGCLAEILNVLLYQMCHAPTATLALTGSLQ